MNKIAQKCLIFIMITGYVIASGESPVPVSGKWTEHGIVVETGSDDAWDGSSGAMIAGLTKKDDTYYLYYLRGFRGCWEADRKGSHTALGVATSKDGLHWEKHEQNPLLIPHDFIDVSSHELGIRHGAIIYVPELEKFIGYFGVDVPNNNSNKSCGYMDSRDKCDCNISVDGDVFYAESEDGINWTPNRNKVAGAYNKDGAENTARAVLYSKGEYYLWSMRQQGGKNCSVSKGTSPLNLEPVGKAYSFSDLPNEPNDVYLHEDGKTYTFLCKTSTSWNDGGLGLGTGSLDNLPEIDNWKKWFPKSSTYKHGKFYRDGNKWLMAMTKNDLRDIVLLTSEATTSNLTNSPPHVPDNMRMNSHYPPNFDYFTINAKKAQRPPACCYPYKNFSNSQPMPLFRSKTLD